MIPPAPDLHAIRPTGDASKQSDLTVVLSDLPDEQNLDGQFGLAETPQQPARTRTGVYIVALRPVEFTANPVASYPAGLQKPRITQDGDIVEATAVSLVPFPQPGEQFRHGVAAGHALAQQIFVTGPTPTLPQSLLPLAMIGLDRNEIQWIDLYLVRRDSGSQANSTRLGLSEGAAQQTCLMQYDARFTSHCTTSLNARGAELCWPRTIFNRCRPPAGFRWPPWTTLNLVQRFFPATNGRHLELDSAADELPAVLEDGLSLAPIDLTLPASSYANLSAFALVPVPRAQFAGLQKTLPPTPLKSVLPRFAAASPILRLPALSILPVATTTGAPGAPDEAAAINDPNFGFYVLQRSQPIYVEITDAPAAPAPGPVS